MDEAMPFARSDIMSTTISKTHGGCGETHRRPFIGGAPAETWELNCPQCREYLSTDPLWSATLADVPVTYDEKRQEESANFTFTKNRDDIMTMALAKIAGLDTGGMLAGIAARTATHGTVKCERGHDNFAGVKFCGECGGKIGGSEATDVLVAAMEEAAATGRAVNTEYGTALPPGTMMPDETPAVKTAAPVAKPARQARQQRQVKPAPQRQAPAPRSLEEEIASTPSI
jgi:hypothetical protein